MGIYDISVTAENGESYQLDRYKGKTMLIVNTATKCGLAPQFDELQALYEKYSEAKQAAIQLMTEDPFCYGVCVKLDFDSQKFYVAYVRSINKSLNDAIRKNEV